MATRRKFLGILGVGAASAPLAAKDALDKRIGDLVVRGSDSAPLAPSVSPVTRYPEGDDWRERVDTASDWLRAGKILPDYVEQTMRDRASCVYALDPDIACKRSWSMSVKIAAQRERQYEREIERAMNAGDGRRMREAAEKLLGFRWPW